MNQAYLHRPKGAESSMSSSLNVQIQFSELGISCRVNCWRLILPPRALMSTGRAWLAEIIQEPLVNVADAWSPIEDD